MQQVSRFFVTSFHPRRQLTNILCSNYCDLLLTLYPSPSTPLLVTGWEISESYVTGNCSAVIVWGALCATYEGMPEFNEGVSLQHSFQFSLSSP